MILLDLEGRVVLMNEAAETLVRPGEGLALDAGRLQTSRVNETALLKTLIGNAVAARNRPVTPAGGVMAVSRARSLRPLSLLVTPLPHGQGLADRSRAVCAVFVTNPNASRETDEELLRRLYGLTRAEARVAALLVQGKDVKRVSEELKVSVHATRTHVQRVLRKTNTRRQAELVALILADPASSRLR